MAMTSEAKPVNKQYYELVLGELQSKGISNAVAQIFAYEILVISNVTGQNYKTILKSVTRDGIHFDQNTLDQLNLMRSSGNKLGTTTIKTTPNLISREII
jgi:hypothetical protein